MPIDIPYRQKLRSGSDYRTNNRDMMSGDSTGCLTDGTDDEGVQSSSIREINYAQTFQKRSTSTQSFAMAKNMDQYDITCIDLPPAR